MFIRHSACLAVLALGASNALAQSLHTVDDDPGSDFTSIQAAIDASLDGDRILIRDGTYSTFVIDGKSLDLAGAEGSAVIVAGRGEVKNVGIAQDVTLLNMQFGPASSALRLSSSAGAIQIDNCVIEGAGGGLFDFPVGLAATHCDQIVLSHTTVSSQGGSGGDNGARFVDCIAAAFDCDFNGGTLGAGIPGKAAIDLLGGTLYLSNCTLTGGPGGDGNLVDCDGAPGGPGIQLFGGEVTSVGTSYTGGPGGAAADVGCSVGITGLATQLTGGTLDELAFTPRSFDIPSPISAGGTGVLQFEGVEGDLIFLLFGSGPALTTTPLVVATPSLGLLDPIVPFFFGTVGPGGVLDVNINVNPPGLVGAAIFYEQALMLEAATLQFFLSTPKLGWVLEAGI